MVSKLGDLQEARFLTQVQDVSLTKLEPNLDFAFIVN
jgi:hypothetical protein